MLVSLPFLYTRCFCLILQFFNPNPSVKSRSKAHTLKHFTSLPHAKTKIPEFGKKKKSYYSIALRIMNDFLELKGNRFLKFSLCPLAAIQKAIWHFLSLLTVPVPAALGQCSGQWQAFNFQTLMLQNNAVKRNWNLTNWLIIFY